MPATRPYNRYQYETSPRKIRPEYTRQTKNKPKYNTTKKVQSKTQNINWPDEKDFDVKIQHSQGDQ